MFVPIGLLVSKESVVKNSSELVKILDLWVLPSYPEFTTNNPGMTKTQCMGVIHSYYASGKIHYSITPLDVEQAVNAFLEDRLWVGPVTLASIEIAHSQSPEIWLKQPSIGSCIAAGIRIWMEALSTTMVLVGMAFGGILYQFLPKKKFKLPENTSTKDKREVII